MGDLYIGLISGTSMDGIDAALVEFGDASLHIVRTGAFPYPATLREQLLGAISVPLDSPIPDVDELNLRTGACFRDAANTLLADAGIRSAEVTAIGSHGQTLRHQPDADPPYTLQIGDPGIIAAGTGITTVADFRSADIAEGGQGAPLVPLFHDWLFRSDDARRCVINIGGIANVTVLDQRQPTTGFDTGPGNTLLDAWIRRHRNVAFDRNGDWSADGAVRQDLLQRLLADPYFSMAPPKSTGFEYFNLRWLQAHGAGDFAPQDVQATLCALTAQTIADAISRTAAGTDEVLVCGGGVHNAALVRQLRERLGG